MVPLTCVNRYEWNGRLGVKASYKGEWVLEERSRKNIVTKSQIYRHLEINRHITDEKFLTIVSW